MLQNEQITIQIYCSHHLLQLQPVHWRMLQSQLGMFRAWEVCSCTTDKFSFLDLIRVNELHSKTGIRRTFIQFLTLQRYSWGYTGLLCSIELNWQGTIPFAQSHYKAEMPNSTRHPLRSVITCHRIHLRQHVCICTTCRKWYLPCGLRQISQYAVISSMLMSGAEIISL